MDREARQCLKLKREDFSSFLRSIDAAVAAAFAESKRHNVCVSSLAEFPWRCVQLWRLSWRRDITGSSLDEIISFYFRNLCFPEFYVGDAGNTSLVDAGTPLGATAVVTSGSAGYLLWECCILASL